LRHIAKLYRTWNKTQLIPHCGKFMESLFVTSVT
jgi:hypothetical protein